jgi:cytochrome c oxidase subunit 4
MNRGQALRPYRHLIWVWAALLALLAGTVASAFVPLGSGNAVINLAIAGMKATLVAIFFMHLLHGGALLRLVVAAALFLLSLLLGLSASDYATRHIHPAPWQSRSAELTRPGNAALQPPLVRPQVCLTRPEIARG